LPIMYGPHYHIMADHNAKRLQHFPSRMYPSSYEHITGVATTLRAQIQMFTSL
jgi:hypothetical protein